MRCTRPDNASDCAENSCVDPWKDVQDRCQKDSVINRLVVWLFDGRKKQSMDELLDRV